MLHATATRGWNAQLPGQPAQRCGLAGLNPKVAVTEGSSRATQPAASPSAPTEARRVH